MVTRGHLDRRRRDVVRHPTAALRCRRHRSRHRTCLRHRIRRHPPLRPARPRGDPHRARCGHPARGLRRHGRAGGPRPWPRVPRDLWRRPSHKRSTRAGSLVAADTRRDPHGHRRRREHVRRRGRASDPAGLAHLADRRRRVAATARSDLGLTKLSVARVVGERLREAGVRYVTGHPGGEVVDLIEGFRQAGLEFVLTRHEAAAAFMADAMASASGIPGVCVATLGPGATNLVTGVAQAHLDRSPLIAFTGQLPADRFEITTHQKLELRALFAPISKWQARLTARNASDVIARALRESLRPRRGPVFVEVPSDVPRQPASNAVASRPHYVPPGAPDTSAVVEPAHAGRAARLLRESRRPLLLVGMDANDEAVSAPLLHLAEEWNIPVMVSPKAKGVFREDHPLFLGTIEMLGTAKLYEFIDSCDLVLMVGFDPVEFDSAWTTPAKVIHIGPLPNNDGSYGSEAELVGPVPAGIA